MTQLITRYFESEDKALAVKRSLQFQKFPPTDLFILTKTDGLVATLLSEKVEEETCLLYTSDAADDFAVV